MSDDVRQSDDKKKRYFRSDDRVFRQGDGWYYSAREGDRGPFANEHVARAELERFIQEQKDLGALKSGKISTSGDREDRYSPRPKPRVDIWKGLPDTD
ncbi:MAG: DUF6316 family protein [Pseudomonadales bacterium]|nr:hypothetical protein [Pseudomonadales bacterium]